ncbi:hypothetical protein HA050_10935 [Iodobacter sp. HSC-16F04]|uniref:Uncharacterized protein n=1 Tax=Iodobacter violaceini TaxID=3044271 RepID=A0ABX0KPZ0_9NEIS|nr:class III lanthipeptide [Iodobacter violacea]NHQ86630.1 hypothetical protein [Iodobacter violacea]
MTNKSENIVAENNNVVVDDKSKVLDLQTLAEISGGVTGETPADWSTVSNHCGKAEESNVE